MGKVNVVIIMRIKSRNNSHIVNLTLVLLMLVFLLISPAFAEQNNPAVDDDYQSRLQAVEQKISWLQDKNQVAKQQYEAMRIEQDEVVPHLQPEDITLSIRDRVLLDTAVARANYDGASLLVVENQQIIDATSIKITSLENKLHNITLAAGRSSVIKKQLTHIQYELTFYRNLIEAEKRYLNEAKKSQELARQILAVKKNYRTSIEMLYQVKQQIDQQKALLKHEADLERKQSEWLNKLNQLNKELEQADQGEKVLDKARSKVLLEVFEAQERSNLIHMEIVLARLYSQLAIIQENIKEEMSLTDLNNTLQKSNMLLTAAQNLQENIERKIELMKVRKEIRLQGKESGLVNEKDLRGVQKLFQILYDEYGMLLQQIGELEQQTLQSQSELQKSLNHALSRRQGLPGFSIEAWANLGEKLLLMPALASQALKAMLVQIKRAFSNLTQGDILTIVLVEFFLLWLWHYCRRIVVRTTTQFSQSRMGIVHNILFIIFELLRSNITVAFILISFLLLIWLSGVAVIAVLALVYLVFVWLVFRMAIQLARLTLLETVSTVSGYDVRLYKNLRWALIGGGVLTMLTVLAQQLPVGFEVRDFFNRLFMLFLSVTALLLLRGWKVVPALIEQFLSSPRPYLMRVVRLLSFLIPLVLLSTGLIGILGYVDLAWTLSIYEGIFLLVISAYVLLRGLLNDFMERLSELCIRYLRNGWFWTQAILRPLDKILHLALFLFSIFSLSLFYGWDSGSYVAQTLSSILHFKIIHIEGLTITLLVTIEFVATTAVLIWVARWTREFAYRWLFAKKRDIGLRNSLAAFTQYSVVALGIMFALKIIGLDLTGISYILTALALGVGFGLRDLAKNYISGILLLIERPVKTGDLVSLGTDEGRVTYIGMRAMSIETWDHMEVLVPNSQIFESTFTNWTKQDSIVRTVLTIRTNREDEPELINQLISEVLASLDEVVSEPSPQVLLKALGDALIEFEVRYFINLSRGKSRPQIRSIVLFAIWDTFEKHNIKPPYPQQDLHVKTLPNVAPSTDAEDIDNQR